MREISKILKLIVIIMVGLLAINLTYASGITTVLSNQNPDPVSPGNYVYLNVKVSNSGEEAVDSARLTFIDNDFFKLAPGEERSKNLGVLPPNSRNLEGTASGFVISKYKILVSEDTPLGLNDANFRLTSSSGNFEYEFEVLVTDQNPRIQVNKFEIDKAEPGKESTLTVEVENINSISLKDVFLTLDLDSLDEDVIGIVSGTNQKAISLIEPGEKKEVKFNLLIGPEAVAKPYLVPFDITYEDSQDNSYDKTVFGSINVFSEPIVSIRPDSQDIYSTGRGKITIAISNPGTSTVKGTRIEVQDSSAYEILDGSSQYVGDLNPDDFQTLQLDVYFREEIESIDAQVVYLDSYNNEITKNIDIPVKIYNQEELSELGIKGSSSGSTGFITYLIALVLIVGAYLVGRRLGFKKGKKSRK